MPSDRWDPEGDPYAPSRPRAGRGGASERRRDPAPWSGSRGGDRSAGPAHTRRSRTTGGPSGNGGGGPTQGYTLPGGHGSRGSPTSQGGQGGAVGRDPRQVRVGGGPVPPPPDGPRHARPDDERGGRRRPNRTWLQRLLLGVGAAVVVICMLGASVAGYALVKFESIDRVGDVPLDAAPPGEPENYLIVAPDYREGQETRNTDTIMVVRIDPRSDRLAVTSFPRDLMVTVADTGETGQINAVYNRPGDAGPHNLIETLRLNYDIPIHHFVEISFESFTQVVDAVGGVTLWMPGPARDRASGFHNYETGCISVNGEGALGFVRSRKMEIQQPDGDWVRDPLSDVNRVRRQQIFIQRALARVLADVRGNPLRARELIDIGVRTVRLDPNLGISDILDLSDRFGSFDSSKLETYPLPVTEYPPDPNRLLLDETNAEPLLNVFRGLAPGEIRPGLIQVTVLNGTVAGEGQEIANLASDASSALQRVGFKVGQPDDADTYYAHTTIEYAPGQAQYAARVAQYITSAAAIPAVQNAELEPGHVRVIAGADFTTIHEQPTPADAMPAAPGAGPTSTTTPQSTTTTSTPTTTAPPPTTTTVADPYVFGSPPEGTEC
jgi:LCP family protein required for cell wall assembly